MKESLVSHGGDRGAPTSRGLDGKVALVTGGSRGIGAAIDGGFAA